MTDLENVIAAIAATISIAVAISSIVAAMKSGVLKRLRLGAFELEATETERAKLREAFPSLAKSEDEPIAFETEQLALYYSQVLSQSKISFWFSLIFASLGFAVILVAAFLYSSTANVGSTVAQFVAGLVMDAVAGLFFVQSKRAQEAMSGFFDKLREDRLQLESRRLCDSIDNPIAKDALKVDLALFYAGVKNPTSSSQEIVSDWVTKSVEQGGAGQPATRSESK